MGLRMTYEAQSLRSRSLGPTDLQPVSSDEGASIIDIEPQTVLNAYKSIPRIILNSLSLR